MLYWVLNVVAHPFAPGTIPKRKSMGEQREQLLESLFDVICPLGPSDNPGKRTLCPSTVNQAGPLIQSHLPHHSACWVLSRMQLRCKLVGMAVGTKPQ